MSACQEASGNRKTISLEELWAFKAFGRALAASRIAFGDVQTATLADHLMSEPLLPASVVVAVPVAAPVAVAATGPLLQIVALATAVATVVALSAVVAVVVGASAATVVALRVA